jgi:O-antigen/teichoic acid export membrane protein
MTRLSMALAVGLALSLGVSADLLLEFWMGAPFSEHAVVVRILMAGLLVAAFNQASYAALVGTQRVGRVVWRYYVPQAVLNLGLSVALVGPLGLPGVALGTVIPAVLLEPIFLRHANRTLDITGRDWATHAIRPWLVPSLAFLPAVLARTRGVPAPIVTTGLVLACGAAYVALVWKMVLTDEERAAAGTAWPQRSRG